MPGLDQRISGARLTLRLQLFTYQILASEFVIVLAYVVGDLATTYETFTRCFGSCDRNPVINQFASMFGAPGVWLWFPFEMALYFLPGAIATWYCYKVINSWKRQSALRDTFKSQ